MLTSVLLSSGGGLVVAIIVSIVISLFSARKKQREKLASMGKFRPQPNASVNNAPAEDDYSSYAGDNGMAGHMDGEGYDSVTSSSESMGTGTSDPTNQPTGKRKKHNKQASANECPKQAAPAIDDTPDSEYSLKDPEAAKRAIIYSEILKPKF